MRREKNMKIHFVVTLGVIVFSILLKLDFNDLLWIFLAIALVMITEILNTFFEKLLDMVEPNYNLVVKHLKDMSAAGVLMASVFAVVVAVVIFGKHFKVCLCWLAEGIFLAYLAMVVIISLIGGGEGEENKSGRRR